MAVVRGELRAIADQYAFHGQIRLVDGYNYQYGFLIRNDGNSTYFLVTNFGNPWGGWTEARPLTINNQTGRISSLQLENQPAHTVFLTHQAGMPIFDHLTPAHIPDLSNTYAVVGHNHDDRYYTKAQCDALFAPMSHDHDGRYYTEWEMDQKLQNKADLIHSHTVTLNYTGSHTHGGAVIEDGYHTHTGSAD